MCNKMHVTVRSLQKKTCLIDKIFTKKYDISLYSI